MLNKFWHAIKSYRDEEDPGRAARLLVRPDSSPPAGVPEKEIPELVRSLLKILKSGDTNPPFGFDPDEKAEERALALSGYLASAAEDLGAFNPKGTDANVRDNKGVIPEPDTLGDQPDFAVHGGNTLLQKPNTGVVGNASKTVPYKFLTFCFYDEQGMLRQIIEEIGLPQSPVRQTLVELGLSEEELDRAHETYKGKQTRGSLPGEPDFRHKQVQFPVSEDSYHSLSPIPNTALHREIIERTSRRFYSMEEDDQGAVYWEGFSLRDMAVGGTQPQNAGLLANYLRAMPCLYAAPPNFSLSGNRDFLRDIKRYETLFPRWLSRHLNRTGAEEKLLKAAEERRNRPNVHTRRRMDRAVSALARDSMVFAEKIRWVGSDQRSEVIGALPPEERTLLHHYFRDLSYHGEEFESLPDSEQAEQDVLERLMDRIKNVSQEMGKLAMSEDVARALRTHLRKQLESL